MAAKSPAKPWETNNISSGIDASGTNNGVITPPQPITKHNNNPHINRAGSSTSNATNPQITGTDTLQPTTTPQQQSLTQQPLMQPSMYGGNSMYGNSMYGNSMYGNSMYGGGMGGMYGGMGGMGMGYGMNGMYGGGMQPMGPMGAMGFMQMSVNNVGRFSQLLQVASQALHMTFSSLVQFAGNIGMLAREFGGFLSGVYIFRFLKWLYLKIKKFLFWIIGKKPSTKEQFEEMFKSAVEATSEAQTTEKNSTHYSWLSIGFYCFGILYVLQWIWKSISSELNQQKKLEQQQQQQQMQMQQGGQMMNPMNPYQQNLAYAQNNPYGYYQPGYNNGMTGMYGAQQMPMMQQQTPQQQQQGNNNKDKDESKQSESLLTKPKEETVNV